MANVRIIARFDIKGENLIKGIHLEGLRVVGDPHDYARDYYEQGIDELYYQDMVASLYRRNNLVEIVRRTTKSIFIPLTVAGGIRSVEDARQLLRAGADKIAINTAAVQRPTLIAEVAEEFGTQCVVLSIEAKKNGESSWECYTDMGRESSGRDVVDWAQQAQELGCGEIMVTSIDKDGTRKGFDVELVNAVAQVASVPLIASGGLGKPEDFVDVVKTGHADAVAVGAALHFKHCRLDEIRSAALASEIEVRTV